MRFNKERSIKCNMASLRAPLTLWASIMYPSSVSLDESSVQTQWAVSEDVLASIWGWLLRVRLRGGTESECSGRWQFCLCCPDSWLPWSHFALPEPGDPTREQTSLGLSEQNFLTQTVPGARVGRKEKNVLTKSWGLGRTIPATAVSC